MAQTIAGIRVWDMYLNGKQRITARLDPCRCGCHGQDPFHKANYKRVVHNMTMLNTPELVETRDGWKDSYIIARGYAAHPANKEIQPVGLTLLKVPSTGEFVVGSWWYLENTGEMKYM